MLQGHELATFRKQLLGWFRQFRRDLPWRQTKDPYRIWLSEIMLQQTRVAAAIPYYERFLKRFPDIHALASAPEEEVLRLWSGLGYYSRARNLQKAAQQIVAKHGGKFPTRVDEVLDGNVARVLARLGVIRGDLRAPQPWRALQKTADSLLDPNSPGDWNQAVMELGATLCSPRSPQCLLCPVAQFCEGCKLGIAESLPEKRKKHAAVEVALAAAVFADKNGWTILLPPPPQDTNVDPLADFIPILASSMWHFPAVAVTGDPAAKLRAFLRNLAPRARVAQLKLAPAGKVHHTVTYRDITITPFRINVKKLPRVSGAQRVPLHDVTILPVSNLTRKVARAVLDMR